MRICSPLSKASQTSTRKSQMKNGPQKKVNDDGKPVERRDLRAQIESRAYELWLTNGCGHGQDLENWLQAERELASPQPDRQRKRAGAP
jgi:hypothetical protein